LLTLFRRANAFIIASLRSRNGEALENCRETPGGGHANAAERPCALVRTIPDAVIYLRQLLNPKKDAPLNSLEGLFDELERRRNDGYLNPKSQTPNPKQIPNPKPHSPT